MKKPRTLFFILFLAFLLIGCQQQSTQETIKIGVTSTLTGFGAPWGTDIQQGITLAVDEVNEEGGINGKPLEVIYEDIQELDLRVAASAAQKLITIDQVDVMFTQWAEDHEVIFPIAKEHNKVVINLASGSRDIPRSDPLSFMLRPTDDIPTEALLDYILTKKVKNPVMIVEQSAYFESLANLANEIWQEKTNTAIEKISTAGAEKDFRTPLLKVKEEGYDALLVYVLEDNTGAVLKTAGELGLDILKVGFTGAGDQVVLSVAGEGAEGMVYPDFVPSEPFFVEKFNTTYGAEPLIVADLAYDAVHVLAEVMSKHGTSTEEIQKGLHTVKDFPGASGLVSINEFGERTGKELVLKEIKNGKGVIIS